MSDREPLYFLSPEERRYRIEKAPRSQERPPSKFDKPAWFAWWRKKLGWQKLDAAAVELQKREGGKW